jgi:hypothetical protein
MGDRPPIPPDRSGEPPQTQEDGGRLRAVVPELPLDWPFPRVLPEDPDEREEVLRRFAEWDRQRREAEQRIMDRAFPGADSTDPADRSYNLVERMRELGAPDPESWARSEIAGDIPQEARWLILRAIWPVIDMFSVEGIKTVPAAQRLLADGADPELLAKAMRYAAGSAVFSTLYEIDSLTSVDAPRNAPGWLLVETRFDPEADDFVSTGRHVGGLHESLSSADPSGKGGADLFE